ncbi:hypothetical protein FIBSPDRAFT_270856 [Athelia psychrophila]|uniref:Uncharacterized protein n=1 Tax=Athelia psychrophila TaxID=1759441 RepID=A0A165WYJ4_9AGAM|nr:hypothetical protein FIBSPDRAFT_270856 [Fibularhizoctonia sp. CBS 109695]
MISRLWAPIHPKAIQVISPQVGPCKAKLQPQLTRFNVIDAQINDDLDQQIRLPVKRRSELHGDATLNHKRMKRSAAFNTEGVSGNARIVNVGRDHITQIADGREATGKLHISLSHSGVNGLLRSCCYVQLAVIARRLAKLQCGSP